MIRLAKGKKDRIIRSANERCFRITVYIESAPRRTPRGDVTDRRCSWTERKGEPINPDSLTEYSVVTFDDSGHLANAVLCHSFRHTIGHPLKCSNTASDIPLHQAMLGHAKLQTTEITQVSHPETASNPRLTHPAATTREERPDDLKATGDDSDTAA